jgi:serine/threonine-protein kinase
VLIGDGGQIAVTETGLVPALRTAAKPAVQPWGRAPYLSPEHAAGEVAIPASDVYVVGLLLYEMLSGRPPFDADDPKHLPLRHLRQEPVPLQTLVPHVPLPLARIVHKALSKEPAARYRNAAQLAHILRSQVGVEVDPQEDLYLEAQPIAPLPEPEVLRRPGPGGDPYVLAPSAAPSLVSQRDTYFVQDVDDWTRDHAGPDWLMIALIVAALIAVLGLIPLWRSVYRRYAVPAPGASPASYCLPGGEEALALPCIEDQERKVRGMAELDDRGLVWYNLETPNCSWPGTVCVEAVRAGQSTGSGEFPCLGVQITVLRGSCIKL